MTTDFVNGFTSKSDILAEVLKGCGKLTIAVSGGVDSMTLSCFAHRTLGRKAVQMVHALSPAVPRAATARVNVQAKHEGWRLKVVDAGEFADERYRANPLNRCFFCKANLYQTLARLSEGAILSGTNCDDLGDFRPGLQAAAEHHVRHPYVEAGFAKADVRVLAKHMGLEEIAELPSSPCLASRVETGIRIESNNLKGIDAVESWILQKLAPETVRCRVRSSGLAVELDSQTLASLTEHQKTGLAREVRRIYGRHAALEVNLETYRQGSAFVNPAPGGTR